MPNAERDGGMLQGGGPVLRMEAAAEEALLVAPGRVGMRGGVVRVEPQRLVEEAQRLVGVGRRVGVGVRQRPEIEIVGVEPVGPLAARPLDLGAPQRRLDRADDALGQPVLQVEDVFDRALELVGPDMGARRRPRRAGR